MYLIFGWDGERQEWVCIQRHRRQQDATPAYHEIRRGHAWESVVLVFRSTADDVRLIATDYPRPDWLMASRPFLDALHSVA